MTTVPGAGTTTVSVSTVELLVDAELDPKDTRRTTSGLRLLDSYAAQVGGAYLVCDNLLSVGALPHSSPILDIAMDLTSQEGSCCSAST